MAAKNFVNFFFIYLTAFFFCGNTAAQVVSSGQSDLCRIAIESIQQGKNANISGLDACTSSPINEDLGAQILYFLAGEPALFSYQILSYFAPNSFSAPKEPPFMSMMTPVHDVLSIFNWMMFSCLIIQALSSMWVDVAKFGAVNRQMQVRKWFHLHGVNYATGLILTVPVFGWMSILHFISFTLMILVVYLLKPMIAILFVLHHSTGVSDAWLEKLTPIYSTELSKTSIIYMCDMERRNEIFTALSSSIGRDEEKLKTSGLFNCLNKPFQPATTKDLNNGNMTLELGPLNQTEQCYESNRAEAMNLGLSEPKKCGVIQLKTPTDEIKNSVSIAFTSSLLHGHLQKIAAALFEYKCRLGLSENVEQQYSEQSIFCRKIELSANTLTPEWIPDPVSNKMIHSVWDKGLTETGRASIKKQVIQEKDMASRIAIDTIGPLLTSVQSVLNKSIDEEKNTKSSADDLALRIDKGGWLLSALFFDNQQSIMINEHSLELVASIYTATPTNQMDSSKISTLFDDISPQSREGKILSSMTPSLKLLQQNIHCWYDSTLCVTVSANPFVDFTREGRRLIGESMLYYVGARLISYAIEQLLPSSSKDGTVSLMAVDIFSMISMLYLLLGVVLLIIIPGYAFFAFFGVLISWMYDFFRASLLIQINLGMTSPELPHKSVFSPKTEEAILQMLGLGVYFAGVILGAVLFLLTMSFFYTLDAIALGWLYSLVGWAGSANSIEALVFRVIFDAVLVAIIFYQVKLSVPILQQVPVLVLQRFKLSMSTSESIGEAVLSNFRRHILPGVSQFLSK